MSLGGLGSRAESGGRVGGRAIFGLLSIVSLILGVGLLGRELVLYSSRDVSSLQPDVYVAGLQVGGLKESEAQRVWEAVYLDQPLTLIYKNSPIIYTPRELGFRTNNEAMLALVRAQSQNEDTFWSGFWSHLWNQKPAPVEVPLDAEVQEGQLRTILEDIAARYDTEGGSVGFDVETLTFLSGSLGSQLDIEAAVDLISQALYDPDPNQRTLDLPTQGISASGASMADLRSAILTYFQSKESESFLYNGALTVGSVFVMDLETGEEMSILGDVVHSGVSTIKVGILINFFRYSDLPVDPSYAYQMASAIICSHNAGANNIILASSSTRQNMVEGLQHVTETIYKTGAINSWLISPLFVGAGEDYPIIAPPESTENDPTPPNREYNAQPDPLNVTTAEDMGTMLAAIYDCAFHGGGLIAIFPDEITAEECQIMIEVMSGVKFYRFADLGVPEGVEVAHKVGYGVETVGDVALVFSPARDYVFVVYIWEENLDNNEVTDIRRWFMIDDLARLVYNYFNADQPLNPAREPVNPLGGAACVLPFTVEEINLNDIDQNRFDANGNPLPTACYDFPACRPFDNWGQ